MTPPRHVLVFESRIEGHHLPWLRMITEDLLAGGLRLTLAVRQDEEARQHLSAQMDDLLPRVEVLAITTEPTEPPAGAQLRRAAELMEKSGAEAVFFCCLDEVASVCLRRAAFGLLPPRNLHGRLGGIFLRPRFLDARARSLNDALKGIGFRRLVRQGWFQQVLFFDELLCERAQVWMPGAPFFPVPDPPTQVFDCPPAASRAALGLPPGKRVFLFYGGAYRRKGLHLALRALVELPSDHPSFLLCVGKQPPDAEVAKHLKRLVEQGRALAINRYVSAGEEKISFCASDVVLLPYLNHFGSSGVLAQAVTAGKPVIASDENLIGRRVREGALGWLFRSGDVAELWDAIQQASALTNSELQAKARLVSAYAHKFSRAELRTALLRAFGVGPDSGAGTPAAQGAHAVS
jgi:glycosyltransferase involved in cell wall biosynthesis